VFAVHIIFFSAESGVLFSFRWTGHVMYVFKLATLFRTVLYSVVSWTDYDSLWVYITVLSKLRSAVVIFSSFKSRRGEDR